MGMPGHTTNLKGAHVENHTAVRAAQGLLSALSIFLCKFVLYGVFVWARRALNGRKRRFPARTVMIKTGAQRMRAFNSLTTSLLLFCIQVVMMFGMKSPPQLRMPGVLLASLLIYCGRRDMNSMMASATPIFTNQLPN